jgi:hypothetical protein
MVVEIKRVKNNRLDFERIAFVCKARTADAERPYTSFVHVERTKEGSRFSATDGKTRLYVASVRLRIPDGDYKPAVSKSRIVFVKSDAGVNFPDWSKAVPKDMARSGMLDLETTGKGSAAEKAAKFSLAADSLNAKTGMVVNMRHIAELPKTVWSVYKEPGFGKVVVKQKDEEDKAFAVFIPVGKAA